MFQFSSFKKNIDSLLAAAVGFCIIILFARHGGIGVSPDSVVYLSTAENLQASGTLTDFTNRAVVEFPAFYPLFIGGIAFITSWKVLVFAPWLNAFLFALVIYLSGYIMDFFPSRKLYKWALLACIVCSPCLLEVYAMLWSETVFIVFVLLFIIALRNYFESHSRKLLVAAALIASLASITRYSGVAIIATGGFLLLLNTRLPLKKKVVDVFLYSAISPLFLVINLIRNHTVGGTLTGVREKSITSLNSNLQDTGTVFYDWLPFLHGHHTGAKWLAVMIVVILISICFKRFSCGRLLSSYPGIAAFFSLVYIVFMVAVASISRFETLNSRFFAPAFIPLLWTASRWILTVYSKVKTASKRWVTVLGILIFLCFQYGQLAADYETWDGVKDAGIPGYAEDSWKQSETVQFIQKDSLPFKKDYIIYSNANDAIYFFTGRVGKFLPHKESSIELQELLNAEHCYLVWFNDGENPDLVGRDFIVRTKRMTLLKGFADGAIYVSGE